MKNIKEFKELIEIYESITLEKIELTGEFIIYNPFRDLFDRSTINKLTGFGTKKSCQLCSVLNNHNCEDCVYTIGKSYEYLLCAKEPFDVSFNAIRNASNAEELLLAVKERAKVMREHLKTIEP